MRGAKVVFIDTGTNVEFIRDNAAKLLERELPEVTLSDRLDQGVDLILQFTIDSGVAAPVSLLCSAIVEGAEAILKRRAKDLEMGIGELLRDPKLVAQLYDHPLINGLFKGSYVPKMRNLPSYIPTRSFALAIMDLLISPDA